jgi:hypothetical protein|nr:MAG TPA: hypothetical protein [Caudoviricetes sp.]
MKMYKGFDKDLKCRDFQYETGKTYEEPTAELCESGFHACERPLDVFRYYAPGKMSRYCEVNLDDVSDQMSGDSKRCGKKIAVKAEIGIAGLVKAQIQYVKEHTTSKHTDPKQATAGDSGAATAGNFGAATAGNSGAATAGNFGAATAGDSGAATAGDSGAATAGNFGAATSRGFVSVGKNGCGLVRGENVKIKGGMGAILVIAVENDENYGIKEWKAFVVDGENIKPDVWYKLKNGNLVEAAE